MFLVCDNITHLCRLCFPGPYDTGKRRLPTNHQGVLQSCYTARKLKYIQENRILGNDFPSRMIRQSYPRKWFFWS